MEKLSKPDLARLLSIEDENEMEWLFDQAQKLKWQKSGNKVHLRALIELSNLCTQNCLYCGIRRDSDIERFTLEKEDVLNYFKAALKYNITSLVIQSGERRDKSFVAFIEDLLCSLMSLKNEVRITLSLGEQTKETYKRWYDAGARRYLLRIETTNRHLFDVIHQGCSLYEEKVKCLYSLKEIGYQVGTGVMIGLPGQTAEDLANDLLFYKTIDADMIGMGPYIPHFGTPLGKSFINSFDTQAKTKLVNLSLKMIACCRLLLEDVNIASTTALNTLDPEGFIKGIKAGANVVMPNFTELKYKKSYQLYEGKSGLTEFTLPELEKKLALLGETINYSDFGDSTHFTKKQCL